MITALQNANLAVRFLLELALLAAVTTAAWRMVDGAALRPLAAAAAAIAVGTAWVLLVHGEHIPTAVQVTAQVAALALGAAALVRLGVSGLAIGFTITALLNAALLVAWNQ
jgi:hypothetical protein